LFPEALLLGMPSAEFWQGEPRLILSYMEARRLKNEREELLTSQTMDYQAWLTGLYCYQAFGVVLANSFSKKGKSAKYPKEPISFKNHKKKERDPEKEVIGMYAGFKALTDTLNKNIKPSNVKK